MNEKTPGEELEETVGMTMESGKGARARPWQRQYQSHNRFLRINGDTGRVAGPALPHPGRSCWQCCAGAANAAMMLESIGHGLEAEMEENATQGDTLRNSMLVKSAATVDCEEAFSVYLVPRLAGKSTLLKTRVHWLFLDCLAAPQVQSSTKPPRHAVQRIHVMLTPWSKRKGIGRTSAS